MQKAYSTLIRPHGSKSFMPSNFQVLDQFEEIEATYLSILNSVIEKATKEYEESIQENASQPENWGEFGKSLAAYFDPTDYSINIGVVGDEETVMQAMELEYGTGITPPKAMLRNAALGVTTEFPTMLNGYLR
jgi:hypothetical protein